MILLLLRNRLSSKINNNNTIKLITRYGCTTRNPMMASSSSQDRTSCDSTNNNINNSIGNSNGNNNNGQQSIAPTALLGRNTSNMAEDLRTTHEATASSSGASVELLSTNSDNEQNYRFIQEGQARMQVPKTVFYNPVQEFNRDFSVLMIQTYLKYRLWENKHSRYVMQRGGLKILDALSATGLRSIRYAKELGPQLDYIQRIVANDLSADAVQIIKKNITDNKVQDKVICSHDDASLVMYESSRAWENRFHVIDIDPFGSAARFLDAAVSCIGESGLLMITCTDTAVLCGNSSESCFARYGSMSLRTKYHHEMGLRIILRSLESHAARHGRFIKPLISLSVDFYMRVFVQVYTQQAETKKSASKLSQVFHCRGCDSFELLRLGRCNLKDNPQQAQSNNPAVKFKFQPPEATVGNKCVTCGHSYTIGGPIWAENLHCPNFIDLLKKELALPEIEAKYGTYRRIRGLVHVLSEETNDPLYYETDRLSSIINVRVPPLKYIHSALLNSGYRACGTHASKGCVKTNAPSQVVWDIMRQWAKDNAIEKGRRQAAGDIIMSKEPSEKVYDFTLHPDAEPPSKKLSLLRFQINPFAEWGPKSKPKLSGSSYEKPLHGSNLSSITCQVAASSTTTTNEPHNSCENHNHIHIDPEEVKDSAINSNSHPINSSYGDLNSTFKRVKTSDSSNDED